jgi:NTE family protein
MTNDHVKTVALALQGGGSHTAFGWGVLDVLLDKVAEGHLQISAISGASGGALTGAVCAYGLRESPHKAKRLLAEFWELVAGESKWPENPLQSLMRPDDPSRWNVDGNPLAVSIAMSEQTWSPYYNWWLRLDILAPLLSKVIPEFDAFSKPGGKMPKLYVSAVAVGNTALRIFGPEEITLKALLASACLPTLFEAVEIDGTAYWDGGYMANPALNPLVDAADDLLTVLIDPLDVAGGPPISPQHIMNRINEVSFGASWVLEMRQIELINKLVRSKQLAGKYHEKRFHLIRDDRFMEAIGALSKMVPARDFLIALRERGRQTAMAWLTEDFHKIGNTSSLNVERELSLRLTGTSDAVRKLARE